MLVNCAGIIRRRLEYEPKVFAEVVDAHRSREVALWWRTDEPSSPATAAVQESITTLPVPHWSTPEVSGRQPPERVHRQRV